MKNLLLNLLINYLYFKIRFIKSKKIIRKWWKDMKDSYRNNRNHIKVKLKNLLLRFRGKYHNLKLWLRMISQDNQKKNRIKV